MVKRKAKKTKLIKNILIFGGVLAALQIGLIVYFQSSSRPTEIRDAIQDEVEKAPVAEERKAKLRVQLSLNHFRDENQKLPQGLEELVPKYFDTLPVDPITDKPFRYEITQTGYNLGEVTSIKSKENGAQPAVAALAPAEQKIMEQQALIASLDAAPEAASYVYDPTGKRDPFRPFDASPKDKPKGDGLTGYDIGQLRLAAIVGDVVSIEDVAHKGFIARKGTKIGPDGGEIVEILSDRIRILETSKDFTGKEVNTVKEMLLRTPGQENARRGK